MRVLITGGAGFIGSHCAEHLSRGGHAVRVLDDLSTGRRENLDGIELESFVEGDICDGAALAAIMDGCDAVVHLAAYVSVPGSIAHPVSSARTNIGGTVEVLARATDAGVKRVIFASSAAVYGEPREIPLPETHPTHPISPYGAHKLAGEHLCRVTALTGGPDTLAFRFFNVFGSRQDPDSDYAAVIPIFRSLCAAGKTPLVHGDGSQTRDFIHVSDVASAIARALEHPRPFEGTVINLARGEATTVDDLAGIILRLAGRDEAPEHGPARPGDIEHSVAGIDRLRRELGWEPALSLEEGLGGMEIEV